MLPVSELGQLQHLIDLSSCVLATAGIHATVCMASFTMAAYTYFIIIIIENIVCLLMYVCITRIVVPSMGLSSLITLYF